MKSRKAVSMIMVGLIIAVVLIAVVGYLIGSSGKRATDQINMTTSLMPGTEGEVRPSEGGVEVKPDAQHLRIVKVEDFRSKKALANNPRSYDITDWKYQEDGADVTDDSPYIIIYFDREIDAKAIRQEDGYFTVFKSDNWSPEEEGEWETDSGVVFHVMNDNPKAYKNVAPFTDEYFYIIRFQIDKKYKDKAGKEWTLSAATANVKFEVE